MGCLLYLVWQGWINASYVCTNYILAKLFLSHFYDIFFFMVCPKNICRNITIKSFTNFKNISVFIHFVVHLYINVQTYLLARNY